MELLKRINSGDEIARHLLFEKYRLCSWRLAHSLLPTYHINGLTPDELMSCAFLAVDIALRSYKTEKGDFYFYWRKISINEINHYLNDYVINKSEFNVSLVSLDKEENGSHSLHDIIGEVDDSIKKDALLDKINEVIKDKRVGLTNKEALVIDLFLKSLSFVEIAEKIKCSRDTVYRHFKSAVKKLRRFYVDL